MQPTTFILTAAIGSMLIAQALKVIRASIKKKKLKLDEISSMNGFPSGHAAAFTGMLSAIYTLEGFSNLFAALTVLTIIKFRDILNLKKLSKLANTISKGKFDPKIGHTTVELIAGITLALIFTILIK